MFGWSFSSSAIFLSRKGRSTSTCHGQSAPGVPGGHRELSLLTQGSPGHGLHRGMSLQPLWGHLRPQTPRNSNPGMCQHWGSQTCSQGCGGSFDPIPLPIKTRWDVVSRGTRSSAAIPHRLANQKPFPGQRGTNPAPRTSSSKCEPDTAPSPCPAFSNELLVGLKQRQTNPNHGPELQLGAGPFQAGRGLRVSAEQHRLINSPAVKFSLLCLQSAHVKLLQPLLDLCSALPSLRFLIPRDY